MPKTISTAADLRLYTNGVARRASHHGPNIDQVWPSILGYVMVYEDNPMSFAVRTAKNPAGLGNQAWAMINGKRIGFNYGHLPGRIIMQHGSQVLAEFTNATTHAQLKAVFDAI